MRLITQCKIQFFKCYSEKYIVSLFQIKNKVNNTRLQRKPVPSPKVSTITSSRPVQITEKKSGSVIFKTLCNAFNVGIKQMR